MTKKDYELIATAIAQSGVVDIVSKGRIAASLAAALADQNPRFDADKFMEWCMA